MKTKEMTAAVAPDDSLTDAQIDRFEARKRERDRIEKIRVAGNLATEERIIVRVGPPVPIGNVLRPSEHALAEDRVKFPDGAQINTGAAAAVKVGFVRPDMGQKTDGDPVLFRDARADEVSKLVTVQLAAGYLEAKGRSTAAADLLERTKAESDRRAAVVEKAEKALADAKAFAADGERMVCSAERHSQTEATAFENWVKNCGRPEESVKAAAELMMRTGSPETSETDDNFLVVSGRGKVYAGARS